jgi:hypothetical protein
MTDTKTAVDILSFNSVEIANEGGELELFYKGSSTGIFLKVLGVQSDTVKKYQKEQLKDYARKQKYAEKKGNVIEFEIALIDRLEERSIENAANRVIGWRGANGAYDVEKLKIALGNNQQWIDEIIDFSNDLGK